MLAFLLAFRHIEIHQCCLLNSNIWIVNKVGCGGKSLFHAWLQTADCESMCYRHAWARLYHRFSSAALDRQKSAQSLLPTLCQSVNEPAMLTSLGWLITIAGHSHLSKVLQNSRCYFTLKSCRHFGTELKSKPPFLPRTCSGWLIIVTAKSLPIVWIQNCNVGRAQRVFFCQPSGTNWILLWF